MYFLFGKKNEPVEEEPVQIDVKDEDLPPHLRHHGRIQSLHEFQERVRSREPSERAPSVELSPTTQTSRVERHSTFARYYSDYHESIHDSFLDQIRSSEDSSSRQQDSPLWKAKRKLRLLFLLLLLGGIAGPLNYALKA